MIYAFFLYVSSTSARAGDDWEVSNWYQTGFLSTFAGMIHLIELFQMPGWLEIFIAHFLHIMMLFGVLHPLLFLQV